MSNVMARSSWQIMRDSVHALLMREIKTRFGANRLGYFWALAEPMAQALVMGAVFTLIGRSSVSGIPVALFIFTGILPFKMFSKLLPQLSAAVKANKPLLAYRQVSAIDPIVARVLLEVAIFIVAYVLIFGLMAWLGFNVIPHDLLALITASLLLIIGALGIGLLLCVGVSYWQDTTKVVSMVMQPMFFISGIFFAATMIPQQYWYLFSWNPVFHAIELSRDAFFVNYVTPIGSWFYLSVWALVSFTLGITAFYQNRMRFLTA
jgi:capsular polysaccharide transport system permease protein